MCGISVTFGNAKLIASALNHRGPDGASSKTKGNCTMNFTRLSINDVSLNGMQPFERNGCMLVCNGEIYNHTDYETGKEKSSSDCECLLSMIDTYGIHDTCNYIRGVFAFAWTDGSRVMAARDPFGVRPLFYVKTDDGIAFASEIKSLLSTPGRIEIFPPGHFYSSGLGDFVCYHNIFWKPCITADPEQLVRVTFEEAVKRRISNTDRAVGFLLSGGLDSSLVAAIASKTCDYPIRTFSIGQADSPDIIAAKKVSDFLGTDHTEILFDFDEGVKNIPDVIKSLESYDTTTIRASTPMWMLSKWISENTDCKVLLSGEGSDEILGGYKYFQNAPSDEEFQEETIRRLRKLHQFDVLRADRCTAAHGLELRVPFLDRDFVEAVVQLDPSIKRTREEKKVLRDAFSGYLPDDILRRPKDAFSDAVGYGWVDHVKAHGNIVMPELMYGIVLYNTNCHNIPSTNEEAWYRAQFWQHFGRENDHLLTEMWRPMWTDQTDPCARYLKVNGDD